MQRTGLSKLARAGPWFVVLAAAASLSSWSAVAQDVMQWAGNFPSIALTPITSQAGVSAGSATMSLLLTGDAEISADNSNAARLNGPNGDTLVTEYALAFDGDGHGSTGGPAVGYTPYDSFLAGGVPVTHVVGDDIVDVTLSVRAQNPAGDVADAGAYSARATLTVTWVGP
jgi:hypothetical protein